MTVSSSRVAGVLSAALLAAACAVAIAPTANGQTASGAPTESQMAEGLPRAISNVVGDQGDGRRASALAEMYRARDYRPLWHSRGDRRADLSNRGEQALAALRSAWLQGLEFRDPSRLLNDDDPKSLPAAARRDYAISERLLAVGLNMKGIDREAFRSVDLAPGAAAGVSARELARAVGNTRDPRELLRSWQPQHPGYADLLKVIARYKALVDAGGWPRLTGEGVVEVGESDPEVATLRRRLHAEGYLRADLVEPSAPNLRLPSEQSAPAASGPPPSEVYDRPVKSALERFQKDRGLTVDGVLGPNSRAALNVTATERLRTAVLNLARYRQIPAELGERHIWVNIPEYYLRVFNRGRVEKEMNIVVGKRAWPTPVFVDHIEYLEVNPYWNVPLSIVKDELAAKIARSPSYIRRNNFEVVQSWQSTARVNPRSVNWNGIAKGWANFDHRIRQKPGPKNALGQVKFIFPNDHAVYLHDTPADQLFSEAQRSFSHGCVRLERPFELAKYVLGNHRDEDTDFDSVLASRRTTRLNLDRPLPVYLVYFTAWLDENGVPQFRDDLYGHDDELEAELRQRRAELGETADPLAGAITSRIEPDLTPDGGQTPLRAPRRESNSSIRL